MLGIQKNEEKNLSLYAAVSCDIIWMRTNEVIKDLEITYPRKLVDQINQVYKNHCQAWEYKVFDKGKVSGWVPPCPPNVKLNFDVAVGRNEACLAAETV